MIVLNTLKRRKLLLAFLLLSPISALATSNIEVYLKEYREEKYSISNPLVLITGAVKYAHFKKDLPGVMSDLKCLYALFHDCFGYKVRCTFDPKASCKDLTLNKNDLEDFLKEQQKVLKENKETYDALIFVWCGRGVEGNLLLSDAYPIDVDTYLDLQKVKSYYASKWLPAFIHCPKIFINACCKEGELFRSVSGRNNVHRGPDFSLNQHVFSNMITIYSKTKGKELLDRKDKGSFLVEAFNMIFREKGFTVQRLDAGLRKINYICQRISKGHECVTFYNEALSSEIYFQKNKFSSLLMKFKSIFLHAFLFSCTRQRQVDSSIFDLILAYSSFDFFQIKEIYINYLKHKDAIERGLLLHVACREGLVDKVALLIDWCSMNINKVSLGGRHALHVASLWGREGVIKLLIDTYKVDVNVRTQYGSHALHYALDWGQEGVIKLLIDTYKVDPDVRDQDGSHVLHYAAKYGNISVIKLLLDTYKVNKDVRDKIGWHMLHYAAEYGRVDAIELLIDTYKVDPDVRDQNGSHALHYASMYGRERVIKLFVHTYKVDVNVMNDKKETPLHCAAYCSWRKEAYSLLLDLGANEETKDKEGKTPKELKRW